jgi:hypothetical protein
MLLMRNERDVEMCDLPAGRQAQRRCHEKQKLVI